MTATRLVETGKDADGRSTISSDRLVDARQLPTGRELTELWQSDHVTGPVEQTPANGLYPPPGGARFWMFTVPASESAQAGAVGMHLTSTTDLGIVLSGQVWLQMEDGSTTMLRQGDAVVQNGTVHRWLNDSADAAIIGLVVLGAGAGASGD
jgi:hypothetical protein